MLRCSCALVQPHNACGQVGTRCASSLQQGAVHQQCPYKKRNSIESIHPSCTDLPVCRLDRLWAKAGDGEERTLLGECVLSIEC